MSRFLPFINYKKLTCDTISILKEQFLKVSCGYLKSDGTCSKWGSASQQCKNCPPLKSILEYIPEKRAKTDFCKNE